MSYNRVIPRDLFNESKLLKCLGQIALLIHDGVGIPNGLTIDHDTLEVSGFNIEQDENDGALYCSNLNLYFHGEVIELKCPYNSKEAYPMRFIAGEEESELFTYDGYLSSSFLLCLQEAVK